MRDWSKVVREVEPLAVARGHDSLAGQAGRPSRCGKKRMVLISRHLERIADHATNIAEDAIYYVEGRDVRHHAGE